MRRPVSSSCGTGTMQMHANRAGNGPHTTFGKTAGQAHGQASVQFSNTPGSAFWCSSMAGYSVGRLVPRSWQLKACMGQLLSGCSMGPGRGRCICERHVYWRAAGSEGSGLIYTYRYHIHRLPAQGCQSCWATGKPRTRAWLRRTPRSSRPQPRSSTGPCWPGCRGQARPDQA